MKSPLPVSQSTLNQHDSRAKKLRARLLAQRERLQELVACHQEGNPELAAHLQSLLLYADGSMLHEIRAATGLSGSAVLRVRRRFECWGLGCVLAPPRRVDPFGYRRRHDHRSGEAIPA